jgi:GT2 family glycosyltransferase
MIGPVVCIPVLRRYDLLRELLLSLRASTLPPSGIVIVDNGRQWAKVAAAIGGTLPADLFDITTPAAAAGVAESWNYFLGHSPDGRVIANDDILFAPQSLERMVETPGDLVLGFGFSCFLMRDSCVGKVGLFDENLSPGYAYFEDCDYMERVHQSQTAVNPELRVIAANAVDTGLVHGRGDGGSLTYRAGSQAEIYEHWQKFDRAKARFVQKWGAEPQVLEARRAAKAEAVPA